jgi:HJR/Mrr/RecB family endonuclease
LKLLPIDKSIEIITLKNIKWEDDNIENQKVYDEADGTVYEINKNIYQSVAIENVTFNPQEGNIDANITLNLGDLPEDRLK